jgi:hypothetical protein
MADGRVWVEVGVLFPASLPPPAGQNPNPLAYTSDLGPRGPGFALSSDEDGQKAADQLDTLDMNMNVTSYYKP